MSSLLEEARQTINEVDQQMAQLFVKRMQAVEKVYEYKKQCGLPILDPAREKAVIEKNVKFIEDAVLKEYYIDFLQHLMTVSKNYQSRMKNDLEREERGEKGME